MRWCISCLAFNLLATNSAVVAVIDFGDVNWGDGDYDLHYLLLDFVESFAMEVARRYGHPNADQLVSKLRYYAMADLIGTILEDPARRWSGGRRVASAETRL